MRIVATLNDIETSLSIEPNDLLLDVLREQLCLTGAKRSCDVQVCGTCTVLVDGLPVSSCSTLAFEIDGRSVTTIEGVESKEGLHPLQEAFLDHGALQCGYCTPGMVLTAKYLLESNAGLSDDEIVNGLCGNICRCTGYVKILAAIHDVRGDGPGTADGRSDRHR